MNPKKTKLVPLLFQTSKFSSGKFIICTFPNTTGLLPSSNTKKKLKSDQGLQMNMYGLPAWFPPPTHTLSHFSQLPPGHSLESTIKVDLSWKTSISSTFWDTKWTKTGVAVRGQVGIRNHLSYSQRQPATDHCLEAMDKLPTQGPRNPHLGYFPHCRPS